MTITEWIAKEADEICDALLVARRADARRLIAASLRLAHAKGVLEGQHSSTLMDELFHAPPAETVQ